MGGIFMYTNEYDRWLHYELDDKDLKPELLSIQGDDEAIKDRFAVSLKFGTAGLRGVIGAGTNRMNVYTVRKATQGLANYLNMGCEWAVGEISSHTLVMGAHSIVPMETADTLREML